MIKAINKGQGDRIETVVIEDIEVFASRQPVINLKVYRNVNAQAGHEDQEKLIVVSRDEIKSIPLHRCHVQNSCGYVPLRSDQPILLLILRIWCSTENFHSPTGYIFFFVENVLPYKIRIAHGQLRISVTHQIKGECYGI